MDVDLEQLAAAVLRLPSADRAQLAARLLASLEGPEAEQAAYDAAWEAERRGRMAYAPTLGGTAPTTSASARGG